MWHTLLNYLLFVEELADVYIFSKLLLFATESIRERPSTLNLIALVIKLVREGGSRLQDED